MRLCPLLDGATPVKIRNDVDTCHFARRCCRMRRRWLQQHDNHQPYAKLLCSGGHCNSRIRTDCSQPLGLALRHVTMTTREEVVISRSIPILGTMIESGCAVRLLIEPALHRD